MEPRPYTRAYWRALRRSWEDATSVIALETLSRPDELRRLGAELGWPAERSEKAAGMVADDAGLLDPSLSTRLFTDLFDRVNGVAGELGLSCATPPLAGTLPSGRINALTIRVPESGEYILAFDTGLWTFCDAVADCVATAFARDGSGSPSVLPQPFESEANRASVAVAARVAARYLFTGNPFFADYPVPAPGPHRPLKRAVRDAFLLLVVGHEFAHLALGHVENAPRRLCSLGGRVTCTTQAPADHACELDADRAGTLLMMAASLRSGGFPFWFTGPLAAFFLRAAGALYGALADMGGGADGSHPPVRERRIAVAETARGALPDDMASSYDYWSSALDALSVRLEHATAAMIGTLVREGWTLAPVWTQTRVS